MIGGIILAAVVVGFCMLMAFGEESDWVRGGIRNLGMIALFVLIGGAAALVLYAF